MCAPHLGYVGFDPLGFSTLGNIAFLREAEVKHGRVAMLAAGGAIAQDLFQFPVFTADYVAGSCTLDVIVDVG